MDAQALVLDRYPDAEAIEEPPIYRHGDFSPIDAGYWGIFADSGATPLGDGATEDKAWEAAARRLSAADRTASDRTRVSAAFDLIHNGRGCSTSSASRIAVHSRSAAVRI